MPRRPALIAVLVPCTLMAACWFAAPASAAAASAATTPDIDPTLAAAIADAPPLHDQRMGISRTEPDYCGPTLQRAVNPNAANLDSIEVGPPKYLVEDLEGSPTWRHCISVLNRFDEPRTISLSTLDVVGSTDPDVTVQTRDETQGAGSWIELSVRELELEPGERVLVPYLLQLPDQLPGGTVVGAIRVSDTTSATSGAGARITRSLVSQLQITSPGGEARELDLRGVRSTRFIWTGRDPEVIRTTFVAVNTGTILDTMSPRMVVDGLFGREVADVRGTPDVVLPDSAQRTTLRWDDVPFIGLYFPELRVKSATGTQTIELPMVIVLPPLPYLIALAVALGLLVFGVVRRHRAGWRAYLDDENSFEHEADYHDESLH